MPDTLNKIHSPACTHKIYVLPKETLEHDSVISNTSENTSPQPFYNVNTLDILTIVFRIILGLIYSKVDIFLDLSFKRGSLLKKTKTNKKHSHSISYSNARYYDRQIMEFFLRQ